MMPTYQGGEGHRFACDLRRAVRPVDSTVMTPDLELATETRRALLHSRTEVLAGDDHWEADIARRLELCAISQ